MSASLTAGAEESAADMLSGVVAYAPSYSWGWILMAIHGRALGRVCEWCYGEWGNLTPQPPSLRGKGELGSDVGHQ